MSNTHPSEAPIEAISHESAERRPQADPPSAPSAGAALLKEIVETVLLFAVIFTIARVTIGNYQIVGQSMEPNYFEQERLLVDRVSPRLNWLDRGDIVIVVSPQAERTELIKRLIGKPGDTIELKDNKVLVNNTALNEPYLRADAVSGPRRSETRWELGEDQYFVMGDNRTASEDSRSFGPIDGDRIAGRALLVYWPFENFKFVQHFDYK
jgi:signal peptidase I